MLLSEGNSSGRSSYLNEQEEAFRIYEDLLKPLFANEYIKIRVPIQTIIKRTTRADLGSYGCVRSFHSKSEKMLARWKNHVIIPPKRECTWRALEECRDQNESLIVRKSPRETPTC